MKEARTRGDARNTQDELRIGTGSMMENLLRISILRVLQFRRPTLLAMCMAPFPRHARQWGLTWRGEGNGE